MAMPMPIQEAIRGQNRHLGLEYEEVYEEDADAREKNTRKKVTSDASRVNEDEPFHHPSSPISVYQNNESLTHENLELLDQSLTLTDNGNGDSNTDAGHGIASQLATATATSPVQDGQHSIMSSSYVTFPSSNDTQSRANSIISSAATSTTNNTTKRRRPRPWDNHVNSTNSTNSTNANANANAANSNASANLNMNVNGETTPLLPPRHKSIYSAKTEKRGNSNRNSHSNGNSKSNSTNQYQMHRHYTDDNNNIHSSNTTNQHHSRVDVPSSPSLRWSGGVFTADAPPDGSGHAAGDVNRDHYGSFPRASTAKGARSFFASRGVQSGNSGSQYNHQSSTLVTSILLFGTTVHFILMALYNTFLHYQAHRLHAVTNGTLYGEGFTPPYWISYPGRIYNRAIGPNAPTLILFGGFHPFLALSDWWRIITGMVCSTSVVDLSINLFLLRVAEEEERRIGSWNMFVCYGISCFMGALASILDMSMEATRGNFTGMDVTGLGGAGIAGVMCTIMVKQRNINRFSKVKGNRSNGGFVSSLTRCGYPHLSVALQIMGGLFLPYKSLASIIGGLLMGICCGLCIAVPKRYLEEWNDADSQASSIASDLEEAFSPNVNTPPRFGYDDSPPPPPSSSSKGLDTPIMRRSILTSPEEDDEIDMMQSLNAPGGLKQRSVKATKKNLSYEDGMTMNGEDKTATTTMYCTDSHLRLVGVLCSMLLVTLSVFYIGVGLQYPSEQSIADSLYGCRTTHALYEYVQDNEGSNDDGNFDSNTKEYYDIANGATVCGEVCIPSSIYDQVMEERSGSSLQDGTCKQDNYQCQVKTDAFDAGFLAIEQELYIQGQCKRNANEDD